MKEYRNLVIYYGKFAPEVNYYFRLEQNKVERGKERWACCGKGAPGTRSRPPKWRRYPLDYVGYSDVRNLREKGRLRQIAVQGFVHRLGVSWSYAPES
jgi:hypothetical protein